MTDYREADFTRLKTVPIARRSFLLPVTVQVVGRDN